MASKTTFSAYERLASWQQPVSDFQVKVEVDRSLAHFTPHMRIREFAGFDRTHNLYNDN